MMIRVRGVFAALLLLAPLMAKAGVFVSINIAPPALPVYEQPECPAPGYIWMPGYWAYDEGDYYWVPGTWVLAPRPGLLWTPGYWGWRDGFYVWNAGYWGPHVGFYGGINYGYGYTGSGYQGGYWHGNDFYYNREVTRVNVTQVTNVYHTTVINNVTDNHTSFNGGEQGVRAQPNQQEQQYSREQHVQPTSSQLEHEQSARNDRSLRASENQGRPPIAATPRPGALNQRDNAPERALRDAPRSEQSPGQQPEQQSGQQWRQPSPQQAHDQDELRSSPQQPDGAVAAPHDTGPRAPQQDTPTRPADAPRVPQQTQQRPQQRPQQPHPPRAPQQGQPPHGQPGMQGRQPHQDEPRQAPHAGGQQHRPEEERREQR